MSLIKAQGAGDASTGFYDYTIDQSLRFMETGDGGSRPYIYREQGTPTLEKKYTISCWFKIGDGHASARMLVGGYDNTTGQFPLYLRSDHKIGSYDSDGVSTYYTVYGNSILRDPSAWYHAVLNFDSANSTAASRLRIYINGVEETITGTVPLNRPGYANQSGTIIAVGSSNGSSINNAWDGHIAEVHYIDGDVKSYTEFGETKNGIWVPKEYSGSYGNNGFYLDFADSSAVGDDESGKDNDFSVSNVTDRVVLDSPTNNWCTLNPLFTNGQATQNFAEGNLKFTADSGYALANGTFAMRSGKWYWETLIQAENVSNVGITRGTNANTSAYVGYDANSNVFGFGYQSTIIYGASGDGTASGATLATSQTSYTTGDIIGCSFDADAGELKFYKNNSLIYTVSSINTHDWMPANSGYGTSNVNVVNFGQDSSFAGNKTSGSAGASDTNGVGDFYYTPPSGFLALCSANLPDPGIDPAQGEEPEDHFNTVLWSGDGSQTRSLTGVGFQPDFTWMKLRSSTIQDHQLYDVVRGAGGGKNLSSNTTAVEGTVNSVNDSDYGYLSSFDSDGFSVNDGATATNGAYVNYSGRTYVAWNWLAGGSASSNEEGSITSSVSANTKAGFSIVTYTGSGSNATIGHGLSSAPEFVVVKCRSNSIHSPAWPLWVSAIAGTEYLDLKTTAAKATAASVWNSTIPTNSVFSVGTTSSCNSDGFTYVAYCFHSVDGYSKVGSYTSNNSSNGTFVYTGFRPAWVIVKASSTGGSNYDWPIYDNKRSPINPVSLQLEANQNADDESTRGVPIDFLSNGFKFRNSYAEANGGGNRTHIYLAFAEQPFKYSNAR